MSRVHDGRPPKGEGKVDKCGNFVTCLVRESIQGFEFILLFITAQKRQRVLAVAYLLFFALATYACHPERFVKDIF